MEMLSSYILFMLKTRIFIPKARHSIQSKLGATTVHRIMEQLQLMDLVLVKQKLTSSWAAKRNDNKFKRNYRVENENISQVLKEGR